VTLHRFFVPPEAARGDRFPVPPAIDHQVRTVLRLRDGARIVLLTGDGTEAVCSLDGHGCTVVERRPATGEPAHRLTVVQSLLKGDALDDVIRHGTEVGVAAFRLVLTDRCVARELSPRRLDRLRAIAREAAEQSERGTVPSVSGPVPFADALERGAVLLFERDDASRLGAIAAPAAIVIGPEGGFTEDEVALARDRGLAIAGLGPRILRSETVAVAAPAAILSRTGDFA
jgi:16S rRNA (uracil1498-N3)-methyltransferase